MDRWKVTYVRKVNGDYDLSQKYNFILRCQTNIDDLEKKLDPWFKAYGLKKEEWCLYQAVNLDNRPKRDHYRNFQEKYSDDPLFV